MTAERQRYRFHVHSATGDGWYIFELPMKSERPGLLRTYRELRGDDMPRERARRVMRAMLCVLVDATFVTR